MKFHQIGRNNQSLDRDDLQNGYGGGVVIR